MKKKVVALLLAAVMTISLAACAQDTPAEDPVAADPVVEEEPEAPPAEEVPEDGTEVATEVAGYSGDVTIEVMLMPGGDPVEAGTDAVVEAVNARLAELGYEFKIDVTWTGGGWAFTDLNLAFQTGDVADIVPAHSWSGSVTYVSGAQQGQYMRLDNPENDLLAAYGPDLYGKASDVVKDAAIVPGPDGTGVYGYIIEKDTVAQLGYVVNQTVLEELGFTMDDFDPNNVETWIPLFDAYKAAYPELYPLCVEGEVMNRIMTNAIQVTGTDSPIAIHFDNDNIAGSDVTFVSRFEMPEFRDMIATMNELYNAGYIDPEQGIIETEPASVAAYRNGARAGEYLVATCAYAPGVDTEYSLRASEISGKDIKITWAPAWNSPIAFSESAIGSGLAVYAGSSYGPEAVTFMNLLNSDEVIANLMAEGIEGSGYTVTDGVAWRTPDRGGWQTWRYGVVGNTSPALPLGDLGPQGNEWVDQKAFNSGGVSVRSGLFNQIDVQNEFDATRAVINSYVIPFGSGALDVSNYDAFVEELKAAGVDTVLEAALAQQDAFLAGE